MAGANEGFDPESESGREVAGEAAADREGFLSLMGHLYRAEVGRATSWRSRLDTSTNWAVVLTASLLTWAFSGSGNPHYVIIVGMVMVVAFLVIEARRYRTYDVWRSRVRLLEENVFANALDPEGAEHRVWRELLSEDLREPTLKTPYTEAIARRLRRVYGALLSVLLVAWLVRITAFSPPETDVLAAAAIGRIPGGVVFLVVVAFYVGLFAMVAWPRRRRAKGALRDDGDPDRWK